jgi:hypothetical protein
MTSFRKPENEFLTFEPDDAAVTESLTPAINDCGKTKILETQMRNRAKGRITHALEFVDALLLKMLQLLKTPANPDTIVCLAMAVDVVPNRCMFQTCAPTTTATPPPCT